MNCIKCSFRNLSATATAIIIKEGKILLVRRSENPYKGEWDFVGGFLEENETPIEALKREVREELGVSCRADYIRAFPGIYPWNGEEYPILSHVFLVELEGDIKLNHENSELEFVPLEKVTSVCFDSNQRILHYVQEHFSFDLQRVHELMHQLDPNMELNEHYLYAAALNGFVSRKYDGDILIGLGWIFPRQTMVRRQAVVEDMIIDSAYRGRGLGREIL
ncbi:MAG: hypothetical protein RL681_826, partial [Candidatus Parcubacteria bacterium]